MLRVQDLQIIDRLKRNGRLTFGTSVDNKNIHSVPLAFFFIIASLLLQVKFLPLIKKSDPVTSGRIMILDK